MCILLYKLDISQFYTYLDTYICIIKVLIDIYFQLQCYFSGNKKFCKSVADMPIEEDENKNV